MRGTVVKNIDMQIILRYANLVNFNNIDFMQPFVLAHDNVIEYVEGTNPKILFDATSIRFAVRRWNKIIELISLNATESVDVDKLYVLGYMYPSTYIVSSIMPRLPYVAEVFGYMHDDNLVLVKRNYTTRKLYVEILKKLAKAVIVKPVL